MAQMKGRNKTVLGLFVDGLDVKLAHLSIKGKRITVNELKSATLATKLHEHKASEIVTGDMGDSADPFALPSGSAADVAMEAPSEDNNAVLLGLLAGYTRNKYSLAYSLAEPAIYYHVLESDFGLKGKKLKSRILDEMRNIRAFQPAQDAVDSIKTDDGSLLCIVREDGLSLINSLENVKGFMGGRIPLISGIDSSDVSLMNLVRMNYEFQPQDVSVVIYVGVEFTRLIFMRGGHFYQFAPIIGEGYDSPNLPNTVYSRLLLEQDNLAIPHISRIILAGESHRINFKEFLVQQLPDQEVDYLLAPMLDTSPLSAEQQEMISEYAVPIGAAWRILDPVEQRPVQRQPAAGKRSGRATGLQACLARVPAPGVALRLYPGLHLADRPEEPADQGDEGVADPEGEPAVREPDAVELDPGAAGAAVALQGVAGAL